jgi:putative CocE/NonD family hydrolase
MGGGDGHRTPEGRLFVGGRWRDEQEWPLRRARPTPLYLAPAGKLTRNPPPASPPERYLADPRHPVPTLGGNISSQGRLMPVGPMDQHCRKQWFACPDEMPLASRNDVLVFETEPLKEDMEVTGTVSVNLWISSDGADTDFTAKLVDVYPPSRDFPAGAEFNIGDSIVRARFRDSVERAAPLTPGQVYPVKIELYPTSLLFARGHRIRLDVASSNFPRFDVNPNTGEPLNAHRHRRVARNAVYHDPAHPSHVLLPVVPSGEKDQKSATKTEKSHPMR